MSAKELLMDRVGLVRWLAFAILQFLAIYWILRRTEKNRTQLLRQSIVIWIASIALAVVVDFLGSPKF